MSSKCISSASGCVDPGMPVRARYVNLYKWAESDAEFVKSVSRRGDGSRSSRRNWGPSPTVVDSYSCSRQKYLRSYTFSRNESVPERTRRCLGKVRERAADLPLFNHHREGNRRKRMRKERCLSVRKVKDMSCSLLCAIFHRFLFCTSSVEVA